MNTTFEIVLIAIIMGSIEAYSLYSTKKYAQQKNYLYYAKAVMGYAIIVLLVAYVMNIGKIVIINCMWNVMSICTSFILGYVVFGESLSRNELIGTILAVFGIIITQIPKNCGSIIS